MTCNSFGAFKNWNRFYYICCYWNIDKALKAGKEGGDVTYALQRKRVFSVFVMNSNNIKNIKVSIQNYKQTTYLNTRVPLILLILGTEPYSH